MHVFSESLNEGAELSHSVVLNCSPVAAAELTMCLFMMALKTIAMMMHLGMWSLKSLLTMCSCSLQNIVATSFHLDVGIHSIVPFEAFLVCKHHRS